MKMCAKILLNFCSVRDIFSENNIENIRQKITKNF